jgi:hypothetical protein
MPSEAAGRAAVDLIVQLLTDSSTPAPHLEVPATLVVRASTARPGAGGPPAAAANRPSTIPTNSGRRRTTRRS